MIGAENESWCLPRHGFFTPGLSDQLSGHIWNSNCEDCQEHRGTGRMDCSRQQQLLKLVSRNQWSLHSADQTFQLTYTDLKCLLVKCTRGRPCHGKRRVCSSLCCIKITMENNFPTQNVNFLFQKSEKLLLFLHAIQQAVASFRQLVFFSPSHCFSSDISGIFSLCISTIRTPTLLHNTTGPWKPRYQCLSLVLRYSSYTN